MFPALDFLKDSAPGGSLVRDKIAFRGMKHAGGCLVCQGIIRLLKNAHLLRCAANLIARRISIYASRFGFFTPCIWPFLNSLSYPVVFQHPVMDIVL